MDINTILATLTSTLAIIAGLILLVGLFVIKKKKGSNVKKTVTWIGVIVLIVAFLPLLGVDFSAFSIGSFLGVGTTTPSGDVYVGDTATTNYINAYYGSWGGYNSKAATQPSYFVQDTKTGSFVLSGSTTASVNTYIGAPLKLWADTNETSYCEPIEWTATEAATNEVKCYKLNSVANLSLYDSTLTKLTVAPSNNSDYNLSIGAESTKPLIVRVENSAANSVIRLGAICTYKTNVTTTDTFEVTETGWTKDTMNKEMSDAAPSLQLGMADATGDYIGCWIPPSPILLLEGKYKDIALTLKTDTVDPVSILTTGSAVGLIVVDSGWAQASDGFLYDNWYVKDSNERHSEVGVAEAEATGYGLGDALCLELI